MNLIVLSFWSGIYKKHNNYIGREWLSESRPEYYERYGNQELVLRDSNGNVGNFITFLCRVALGQRSEMLGEEIARNRDRAPLVQPGNGEKLSIEWMQHMQFSAEDILVQLRKLKGSKKAGPNGLKNEMYKWLLESDLSVNSLVACFNNIQQNGPPQSWKNSKTVLIPKKKKPASKDLRPISLTDTSYKIYMSLCKDKIMKHLAHNNQFSAYQSGFTGGRRLEDNLFTLLYFITESKKSKNH